jgi:preprotein translocase subunit SecF
MNAMTKLYRGENNYNFLRIWHWSLRVSAALFVLSLISLGVRGLNLGIDFEGGVSWEAKAPGVTVEQARDAVRPLGLGEAKIQTIGRDVLRVQGPSDSAERQAEVQQALAQLTNQPATAVNVNNIGPTWGSEVTASALRALIVFLLCILAYVTMTFRGEWKLAIGVVAAVIHDVVISVGLYSIFQFEVTPATVIAFLTILGFSIYDTVVVYDKVSENSGRVGVAQRMAYSDMMNLSMNQVLLRSVNTSVVGVLPVLSTLIIGALILGAATLEEFAIALTVGLVIGAYSSIFVAAPVVVAMKEREPRYRQLRERLAKGDGTTVSSKGRATTASVPAPTPGSPADDGGAEAVPVGAGAPVGGSAAGEGAPARVHPPRPRKKGKRR